MAREFYLDVDASDLTEKIERLRSVMTEQQFINAMHGIFNRTGGHVKAILKQDVPHKYMAKKKAVGESVQKAKVTSSGLGVGCTIPITKPRHRIGQGRMQSFQAIGGRHDAKYSRLSFAGKRYTIRARIYADKVSELPEVMKRYGGNPPFRNYDAEKLNNQVFTRTTKKRLPIRNVMGIAIPQMPMNRSEPEVQKDIKDYLEKEMERRFNALLATGR